LTEEIKTASTRGQQIMVVTSGAVALGCASAGLDRQALTLEQSQAAAAIGQIALTQGWQDCLAGKGLKAAQILLTIGDTEERRRYLNARRTLQALLDMGTVPIINENDTVATQELRYGDNDRLAARVAGMMSADVLILLSDVDGFYTAAPETDKNADLIREVTDVNDELLAMAGGAGSAVGSGGMVTKLQAAQIAMQAGCHMILTDGRGAHPLSRLHETGRATLFRAMQNPLAARKNWIAGTLQTAGQLHIDAGAVAALRDGKSLLPIGVTQVSGHFERGDCVQILDCDGSEIARGLTAYALGDAQRIIGRASTEIVDLLGFDGRREIVHRDDLVMNQEGE
ncbi:MAG TPA: glutamate 5-kinase, partial [Rhodobiaceae bacterium]|nr:glutamate 5-kinase [Rhodobiaceae bacterium]